MLWRPSWPCFWDFFPRCSWRWGVGNLAWVEVKAGGGRGNPIHTQISQHCWQAEPRASSSPLGRLASQSSPDGTHRNKHCQDSQKLLKHLFGLVMESLRESILHLTFQMSTYKRATLDEEDLLDTGSDGIYQTSTMQVRVHFFNLCFLTCVLKYEPIRWTSDPFTWFFYKSCLPSYFLMLFISNIRCVLALLYAAFYL